MTLADKVVELGWLVHVGAITHQTAVQQLVEYTNGGLTELGAADELDRWHTARSATPPMGGVFRARRVTADPQCTCTVDPDGARNMDGCPACDLPPCGFLVDEVNQ